MRLGKRDPDIWVEGRARRICGRSEERRLSDDGKGVVFPWYDEGFLVLGSGGSRSFSGCGCGFGIDRLGVLHDMFIVFSFMPLEIISAVFCVHFNFFPFLRENPRFSDAFHVLSC